MISAFYIQTAGCFTNVASIGNVDDLEGNDDFDDNQENSEIGSKGCMSQIDQA